MKNKAWSQAIPHRAPLVIFVTVSICDALGQQDTAVSTLPPTIVTGTNSSAQTLLQSAPESITSLSRENLERAGINSTIHLQQVIPNFSQSHAGMRSLGDVYSLRGLGNTEFFSDPAVVLYIDDAPFQDVTTYGTDFLSVERVDVYRGPQGTRFGKNAEAGVMNITTRRPGPNLDAEARASVASFDTQEYRALAMSPIIENKLSFSLTGQYARSDGFIHNAFLGSHADEQEGLIGRARLFWTPSENWEIDFSIEGHRFDDGVGLTPLGGDPRTTRSDFDGTFKERVNGEALRVKGELSGLILTSVTARRDYDLNPFQFDPDFSPVTGNTVTAQRLKLTWSEELRLRPSDPCDGWNWQAGFFFSTADTHVYDRVDFYIPPLGLSAVDILAASQTSDTYALFGDCTRTIGKLGITVGVRLDETTRGLDRSHQATLGSVPPSHATHNFYNAAPELTLSYHLTEALLLYGKTGIGFKPGGFSPNIDPPMSPMYLTETAWASEIGAKSSWVDGRLIANVALFYNDVRNYQVEQFIPNGVDFTIVNAPRAHTMGLELEVATLPLPGLKLSAFSGVMDARLERYTNPLTGETVTDTHPPFVPNFNAGAAAEYDLSVGLFGRLEYAAFGDTFYDAANSPALKQSAYGLLGARIGFERKHWALSLFAQNIADANYYTEKLRPLNAGAPGQPRTFGLMVTARY
jgi:iron complex outermembrane receptor protein